MDTPIGNKKADLVYKKTSERDIMLTFLPPINKKYTRAPIYFIISGGGWHTEERQSMIDFSIISVERLRKEGFAVVSIDYRVSKEGVHMRDIITDCFDAARYIAHFADILEVDKDSFVTSGHSAGAHLALMLAYAPQDKFQSHYEFKDSFSVKAVASMSPPTFLYDNSTNNLRDISDAFRGNDTKEEREYTSPATYVTKNSPPSLLLAGTSDWLVFSNSSERLFEKLKENNVDSEIILSVGGGHCFEQVHKGIEPSVNMEAMQTAIIDFVLKRI